MDLRLYTAVLMRHKLIVGVGLVAATCLAVFGAQRAKPTYSATAQILVTQQGFPLGRSALGDASNSSFADPARFDYLAQVYAELAATDVVRKAVLGKTGVQKGGLLVLDDGKTVGTYGVSAQTSDIGGSPMPFLAITAQAASAREATEIASRATAALRNYLERSQDDAGITGKARVELPVITKPTDPKLAQSRPLVMPLALFVLAVGATVGLVFFVENLRGGRRLVRYRLNPTRTRPRPRMRQRPRKDPVLWCPRPHQTSVQVDPLGRTPRLSQCAHRGRFLVPSATTRERVSARRT